MRLPFLTTPLLLVLAYLAIGGGVAMLLADEREGIWRKALFDILFWPLLLLAASCSFWGTAISVVIGWVITGIEAYRMARKEKSAP